MSSERGTQSKSLSFIFYDFETQQHEDFPGDNSTRVHKCNIALYAEEDCAVCGKRESIFSMNPVAQVVQLALASSKKLLKNVCIAHNARGFDAQLILRYLVRTTKKQLPTLIMNGTKIITMKVARVVFRDCSDLR